MDGGTPASTVLCELTRNFQIVLSSSCMAEAPRSGEWFQVVLDRGCPCLQLASSSSAPCARRCGKEKALDQLTFGASYNMTKPAEPSLHKQCRYTCRTEAATQFHGWHTDTALYCQRPPASLCRQLVQVMSRNRRAKLSTLLPGRPCPLYAAIFHAATKDRNVGERMRKEQD